MVSSNWPALGGSRWSAAPGAVETFYERSPADSSLLDANPRPRSGGAGQAAATRPAHSRDPDGPGRPEDMDDDGHGHVPRRVAPGDGPSDRPAALGRNRRGGGAFHQGKR